MPCFVTDFPASPLSGVTTHARSLHLTHNTCLKTTPANLFAKSWRVGTTKVELAQYEGGKLSQILSVLRSKHRKENKKYRPLHQKSSSCPAVSCKQQAVFFSFKTTWESFGKGDSRSGGRHGLGKERQEEAD